MGGIPGRRRPDLDDGAAANAISDESAARAIKAMPAHRRELKVRVLALDAATEACSVALLQGGEVLLHSLE